MPIDLSNEEERLTYEYEDSKIFYHRISKARLNFIQKAHNRRGIIDWNAVTDSVLRECIISWQNVNSNGKPVAFNPDLILKLPLIVHNDLVDLIIGEGSYHGEEAPEKNSGTSSSGK